ncbi:hypothetical protein [Flavobacterium sp.]|uniref:hypothetical protein n=1 Tax=Flavobacterium sp. TaxID=239 RepID=UPI00260A812E|nr:hypothetical protein [Flavobacterium sp.]
MKTKTLQLFLLAVLFTFSSCSNDDEKKEAYVKKIVSTSSATPSANQTIDFVYNSKKRIFNYTITKSSGSISHDIIYNSSGLITKINRTSTSASTSQLTSFIYSYTDGKLSKLEIADETGITNYSMDFTYDEAQNKYLGDDNDGYVIEIRMDANENIKQFVVGSENSVMSYNANSGLFKNTKNNVPLLLTHFFSSESTSRYLLQLFANKEISSIEAVTTTLYATTTRDENNLITQIDYSNSSSSIFSMDVTYENR